MIDILLSYLMVSVCLAQILFIWFNTNAFVEYMSVLVNITKIFRIDSRLHITEYQQVTIDDPDMSYPQFLVQYYTNFFTKLVSCPKCIGFQLNLITHTTILVALGSATNWLVLLVLVPSTLIGTYFSLFLYYQLVKLLKHE